MIQMRSIWLGGVKEAHRSGVNPAKEQEDRN